MLKIYFAVVKSKSLSHRNIFHYNFMGYIIDNEEFIDYDDIDHVALNGSALIADQICSFKTTFAGQHEVLNFNNAHTFVNIDGTLIDNVNNSDMSSRILPFVKKVSMQKVTQGVEFYVNLRRCT